MPRRRNSPTEAREIERKKAAFDLRKAGDTYAQIAAKLGFASESGARKCLNSEFSKLTSELAETVKDVRAMDLSRLDTLQAAVWPACISGDPKAIGTVLRIMERRAKLMGLDAPQQLHATGSIEVWAELMRAAAMPDAPNDIPGDSDPE